MLERMVLHMSELERRGAGYERPNTCFDILGQHVVDVQAIVCTGILLGASDARAKAGTRSDAMICGSNRCHTAGTPIKTESAPSGSDEESGQSMAMPSLPRMGGPTNPSLQRFPLAKYTSFCVLLLGLSTLLYGQHEEFLRRPCWRFFLGVCEAAVTPGFALIT
ncbi:MAG: hypothetical protein Q9171_002178 [Xanthocarpia ochracea]